WPRSWARVSTPKALWMRWRRSSAPIRTCARTASVFWTPIAGWVPSHSRIAFMLVKLGAAGIHEAEDSFTAVVDGQALPDGPVIVPLARFQAERESLLARKMPVAVRLETAESPEKLGADLEHLAAI